MTAEEKEENRREWHLDRKVTLGLILALLANSGATVWWASRLEQRVAHIEASQSRPVQNTERIARVETKIESAVESLERIERKLDRVIENR